MQKMLRVSEWLYLAMAAVSLWEIIQLWGDFDSRFLIFSGFLLVSILMYYIRRSTRKRLESKGKN
jgi:hypothetical protein